MVQAKDYTPNDVYAEALLLEKNIKQWHLKEGKLNPWVTIAVENHYKPRHVFQKAVVIIEKINRYRVNVLKIGAIPVNYPGGREITPNEVYNQVYFARQELLAMLNNINIVIEDTSIKQKVTGKAPNDVYAKLEEISLALDGSLGLRGISPSDVYVASQQIVSLARFLRVSQNLPVISPIAKRTKNKHPNHTLAAVKALTVRINAIDKSLSMDPVRVIDVPKRVISPSDVYSAMGIVFAELQRIQYHLGLERYFPQELTKTAITSDDIIFNINYAQDLLPPFLDKRKLQQYDVSLLIKTPNDVYSLTHHILKELFKFCRLKGIRIPPFIIPKVKNLQPRHVFTQGLETLEMIVLLRENQGLGLSAAQNYPEKEITPQEVFDLSLRVDEYLNMVFTESGMVTGTWIIKDEIEYFFDKKPSDAYINMWKIASTLKAILSNQGFDENHLFQKVDYLVNKIDKLNSHFAAASAVDKKQAVKKIVPVNKQYKNTKTIGNKDVLQKAFYLKKLIAQINTQQGLSTNASVSLPKVSNVKIADIYSVFWQLDLGISEMGLFWGIDTQAVKSVKVNNKQLIDVYRKLLTLEENLLMLSRYSIQVNSRNNG
ncbi:hypothetical protein CXF85_00540 [Colwellia sp. 75C3]|nr:hypothetical protein CXF85_00540 [Colwellia sp. 75C3]